MPFKFVSFAPIRCDKKPACSCPNCGSEDFLISENGKVLICEHCGKVTKDTTPEPETHETVH